MKSSEFIIETASEEQELMILVRKLGNFVKSLYLQNKLDQFADALVGPVFSDKYKFEVYGIPLKKIVKPNFKEPGINAIIHHVYLCNSSVRADNDMQNSLGAFGHGGTIYLNIRLMDDINDVYTVLAHELRHALDFYKRSDDVNDKIAGTNELSAAEYIIHQDELNARFTQAIKGINDEMPIARDQLANVIMKHFDIHHLIDVFPNKKNDPRFKQLVKRAVKFFEAQHQANNAKPGFIQRAIKFITFGIL